jgi:peroxiredoxin
MKKGLEAELTGLRRQTDALRRAFAADPAALPARLALQQAIRALVDGGVLAGALAAGDQAPGLVLPDAKGKPVALAPLLRRGPVVLVFYRGDWCPYCRLDLQGLNAMHEELRARNASLLAISPQTVAASRRTQRLLDLDFPLLSDAAGTAVAAFRLAWSVPAALRQRECAGKDGATLPMAAHYVIGRDGIIAYAEVNADPRFRGDPASLVPVLDILRDQPFMASPDN